MSKPVPRSRLNISYRTKIEGQPKKAKLPMRFLVLGDFTGNPRTLLGERPVHSILPGMQLQSFMEELQVTAPIDEPSLRESLFGVLDGEVTGKLLKVPSSDDKRATVKITGKGKVSGELRENGLGSFVGEVQISGEVELPLEGGIPTFASPVEVELHLFGKVEPPAGAEIGLCGDVDGKIKITLAANVLGDQDTNVDLRSKAAANVPVALTIPLRSINDFKPLHLAASVPEIRRLVLLHRLVLEARNFISSFPELREVVKAELTATRKQMDELKAPGAGSETRLGKLREELRTLYPQLLLDTSVEAEAEAEAAE